MSTERPEKAVPTGPGTAPRPAVSAFAAALRELKAVSDLSLSDLQRRTGLPRSTIANSLNPNRASLPPWERIEAILRALKVRESDLSAWRNRWIQAQREAAQEFAGEERAATAGRPAAELTIAAEADSPTTPEQQWAGAASVSRAWRLMAWFRRPVLTHAATLMVGVTLGCAIGISSTTSPLLPGAVKYNYPVEEQTCPPAPTSQTPVTSAPVASAPQGRALPAWVARPASDQEIQAGTAVDLPITTAVTSGDSLIVSVMLTAVCPGTVTVTDTQHDKFQIVGDVTDSLHHRTLLLAAFSVRALTTADNLHVVYPHVSKYHVAVDEFRGISAALQHAEGRGERGGTAFTTSEVPLGCRRGDLLVSAVGTNSGTGAQFAAGWTPLPALKLSSYRLTTAYRAIPADQTCASTGFTTAQWGAVAVVFR